MSEESLAHIDAQARELAQAHLEGDMSDEQVREQFADLIFRTQVAHDVARSRRVEATSHWEDLEGMVGETLTIKAFTSADRGGLDIERIAAGASLSGWARTMGKLIAISKHRDLRVHTGRSFPYPVVGTPEEPTPFEHPSVATAAAEQDVLDRHSETVLEVFDQSRVAARNEAGKVRAQARALRLAYHLPAADSPKGLVAVYQARRALERDTSIALSSMTNRRTGLAHKLLSPMWEPFSDRDISVVNSLSRQWGDRVASLLLSEKLVAEPRPATTIVRPLKDYLIRMNRATGWAMAVDRLLESFLAVSCTPLCSGDHRADSAKRRTLLEERHQGALAWDRVVAEHLAAYPQSPIGNNAEEIAQTLIELLDEVVEDPAEFSMRYQ